MIIVSIGFLGFKKENHSTASPKDILNNSCSVDGRPGNKTDQPSGIKQLSIFTPEDRIAGFDTTKKAKTDTTKKNAAAEIKKITADTLGQLPADLKEKTVFPDTTKKNIVAGTKKVLTDTLGGISNNPKEKSAVIPADTTKKNKAAGKGILADTLKEGQKDLLSPAGAAKDTVKRDSISPDTRYLVHLRRYTPYINLNQSYISGFYDPFQGKVLRTVKLDSTGTKIIIRETIAGQKMKPDIVMPVEEYLALQSQNLEKEAWEKPFRNYEKKETKKDLKSLMGDFTKVDIPLPSVSFLSIFGEPKIQLEVNGSVKVHAGWRNEVTEGSTLSYSGNTKNEPDFSQEIQIGLNGKIGDKLTIGADWGTKRSFQYENILKIKYTGYEDEIVQSVDAGNVSMQTSSLIGGSEALFGVKAKFQVGPLKLEALASQKRSQSEQKNVTSGSSVTSYTINEWNYSTNHYFIDTVYASNELIKNYYGNNPPQSTSSLYVSEIEVWKTTTGVIQQGKERRGNAYLDLPSHISGTYNSSYKDSTLQTVAGTVLGNQRFIKLESGTDYSFNAATGVISFKTVINESEGVAVAYKTNEGKYFGEFASDTEDGSILVLKLVKPPNLQPSFRKAWKLLLKNVYSLGGKKINKEGFKLYIKYQVEGVGLQDNIDDVKLLNAFGFDKLDASSAANPDNEFDWNTNVLLVETGEVIFPMLQPFGENMPEAIADTSLRFTGMYTKTQTMAKLETAKDKFVITGQYSAATSSTITIVNAVENSVKVTLDGVELTAGADYTVEYLGSVTTLVIKNARALVTGANLSITYEQNDMVSLASKTLLGLRGTIDLNKDTKFGFTAMNLTQQSLSDKVTIGQEPLSNSMYGIDFSGSYNLPFLTKAVNNIIPTNSPSKLALTGEFAYINPEPNTKKSTIASDDSKSIAYVDDFEGSRKTIPIGANYGGWHDISFPRIVINGNDTRAKNKMPYKVKVNWYTDLSSSGSVTVADLYGDERASQLSRDDQRITAMDFWYKPAERGYYNRKPSLPSEDNNWGGMMRCLSTTASNLIDENMQYIEFWFYIKAAPSGSKLYIDLGQISEDVIPNDSLNTEDTNMNDAYDSGEDVGLDGITNSDELNDTSLESISDPSNDDYDASAASYSKINGTEGNSGNIDLGKLPDTEDLNRNWFLDNVDNFFRYEMPIDTSSIVNPYIVGGGKDGSGWYLVRIPLNKYKSDLSVGSPDLQIVETIRFFVHGVSSDVHLRFAEINLVGNQWRKLDPPNSTVTAEEDEVLLVQTISIDDNSSYYSPSGLKQEVDRTKTDKTVYKNEQSLNLIISDLEPGDYREIIKDYSYGLDVFNYKEMKMFVHGDESPSTNGISYFHTTSSGDSVYNAQLYFRFGADTLNFYEYRMPVKPGWVDMDVVFANLTAIKLARTKTDTLWQEAVSGYSGHYYGVRGSPSLTSVKYFTVGILNPVKTTTPSVAISGNVWINELRVLDADSSPGWSYTGTASFKLADIFSVNFTMQNKNPYFHKIAERFGDRSDQMSWTLTTDVDLIKFIPFDLPGSTLKLTYTKSEATVKPLYLFSTDIKVSEAVAKLEQQLIASGKYSTEEIEKKLDSLRTISNTITVTETYSMPTIAIRAPADNWFYKDIINGFTFGFNYTASTSRTAYIAASNSWQWDAKAQYQIDLSRKGLSFSVAGIPFLGEAVKWSSDYGAVRVNFFPQTIEVGATAKRSYSYSLARTINSTTSTATISKTPSISRNFTTTRYMNFLWTMTENGFLNLTTRYELDISGSNAYLLADDSSNGRSERDIWKDIFKNGFFGKDYEATQRIELRANPRLPDLWGLKKYLQMNLTYNVNYAWENDFSADSLGKSASYNATFKFSTALKWKSLAYSIFGWSAKSSSASPEGQNDEGGGDTRRGRGRGGDRGGNPPGNMGGDGPPQKDGNNPPLKEGDNQQAQNPPKDKDTSAVKNMPQKEPGQGPADTTAVKKNDQSKPSTLNAFVKSFRDFIRFSLFDYDKVDFGIELQNSYGGSALKGDGNGFNNFWGFIQDFGKGPSRLFMLGLTTDLGPRVASENTVLSDNYSQKHKITLATTKPLWEGAELSLNWSVSWGFNKTTQMTVNDDGSLNVTSVSATGTIERSFLTIPPVLMFSTIFNNGIKRVHELYTAGADSTLSDAFINGFETFPFLSKIPFLKNVLKYIPRPNWSFTWSGLEKFPVFSFAKRASLMHAYSSSYKEGWKVDSDGNSEIQSQTIEYSFAPLIGLSFSFEQILGGTLTTSVKYNTKSTYGFSAGSATTNITLALQNDMDISASFLKSGFEIPLFGLALKNDIEFSISFTLGHTSNILYKMEKFKDDGDPVDGTIRTKISPKIKYNMSQKVNISIYYDRTTVKPEGASRTIATTTNQAGIDIEISIGK